MPSAIVASAAAASPTSISKVEHVVDRHAVAGRYDRGRLALLDDRRSLDLVARAERVAVVDIRFAPAALEPGAARALDLGCRVRAARGARQRQAWDRPGAANTEIDRFEPRALVERRVARRIGGRESGADRLQARCVEGVRRQGHGDVMHLADQAHIGGALDRDVAGCDAGLSKPPTAFAFEVSRAAH